MSCPWDKAWTMNGKTPNRHVVLPGISVLSAKGPGVAALGGNSKAACRPLPCPVAEVPKVAAVCRQCSAAACRLPFCHFR